MKTRESEGEKFDSLKKKMKDKDKKGVRFICCFLCFKLNVLHYICIVSLLWSHWTVLMTVLLVQATKNR